MSTNLETLPFNSADDSRTVEYSRETIPNDQVVEPYDLTGFKRAIFLILYVLVVASTIAGLIYTFYASPLFGLLILPISYVINNALFVTVHSRLHASFIELPESKMSVICHNSFIHHYRNSRVYHEKWLETRMSYFLDARTIFDPTFRGYGIYIPLISVVLFRIHPVLGIAFFSSHYFAELVQSTIHEWYHNPVRNRKTFYSFPAYWAFTLLEKTGLASTKRHTGHHQHQLHNLDNVDVWLDLRVPFFEAAATRLWKSAIARYIPGQTKMTDYITRAGTVTAFFLFIAGPAIYAGIFLKFFR